MVSVYTFVVHIARSRCRPKLVVVRQPVDYFTGVVLRFVSSVKHDWSEEL